MGRIISDGTPEQERAFVEERRKFAFLAASQWPLSWIMPARRHKRAADALYEIAHNAYERDRERLLAKIKAGSLHRSGSRTLEGQELEDFYDGELLSDYFILTGYALECIFKGYLLGILPDLVKDEKRLDKTITTHDLVQLCHDCGMSISTEEQEVLEFMTLQVVWRKYAGPLRVKDMPSPVDTDDPNTKSLSMHPFHERQLQLLVNGIFQRGFDLLSSLRDQKP